MHPLTKLIYPYQGDGNWKEQTDKIITTYLKEHSGRLKDECHPHHYTPLCIGFESYNKLCQLIDLNFELDEKCEPCKHCGLTTGEHHGVPCKPTIPAPFMSSEHFDLTDVACKIGDIIDYLHSKEAR